MAHDERRGLLTLPSGPKIIPSYTDGRQWILAAAADRKLLAALSGGAGRYDGGADTFADLPSATTYPAFVALLSDGGDQFWAYGSDAASDITFEAADTATGALYLVPAMVPDVDPAAAIGGWSDFELVAVDAASPPAHGLLLGTGPIASSAFTDFTGEAAVAWPPAAAASAIANDSGVDGDDVAAALDALEAAIGAGGGGAVDSVFGRTGAVTAEAGDYTAEQVGADPEGAADDAVAAHEAAADPHPQYLLIADQGSVLPTMALTYGPPTDPSPDGYYLDAAGGLWYGLSLSWRQLTAGEVTALPEADDFESGELLDGYRVWRVMPDGSRLEFYWDADVIAAGAWLSAQVFRMDLQRSIGASLWADPYSGGQLSGALADVFRAGVSVDPTRYDGIYIEGFGATADVGGSPDETQYLGLELVGNETVLASLAFNEAGYGISRYAAVGLPCGVGYWVAVNGYEVGSSDATLDDIYAHCMCRMMIGGEWDAQADGDPGGDPGDPGEDPGGGGSAGGGGWCPSAPQSTGFDLADEPTQDSGAVDWIQHDTLWWEAEFMADGTSNRLLYPTDITIPPTATLLGVQVEIRRQNLSTGCPAESEWVKDSAIQLCLAGVPIGTAKANPNAWPTEQAETILFGGSSDLWGAALTAADVNSGDLAVGIIVQGHPDAIGMGAMGNVYRARWRFFYAWEAPLFTPWVEANTVTSDQVGDPAYDAWTGPEQAGTARAGAAQIWGQQGNLEAPGVGWALVFQDFPGLDVIPDTATITGLAIEVMRIGVMSEGADAWIYTQYAEFLGQPATPLGEDDDPWCNVDATEFFASADEDLPWEIRYIGSPNNNTTYEFTPAQVKHPDFGFQIVPGVGGDPGGVDHYAAIFRARLRVFYVEAE